MLGTLLKKKSEILKVARKTGRSGEMVFVTVAHRYSDAQGLLLNEEHDIVYCENPADVKKAPIVNVAAKIQATCDFPVLVFERKGEHTKPVHADSIMLYRYSAATFNGHRIHYDVDYCRDVEGYPGLVVHGPLIATLLLGYVENEIADGRSIKTFEFRANRPTFDTSDFHLHASKTEENNTWQVWSTNNMGQIGIDGRMTLE